MAVLDIEDRATLVVVASLDFRRFVEAKILSKNDDELTDLPTQCKNK